MNIGLAEYRKFRRAFNEGEYKYQRLGQAFYNHFKLYRMGNQNQFDKLYQLDGEEATDAIKHLFMFN